MAYDMSRRDFLRKLSYSGAGLTLAPIASTLSPLEATAASQPTRVLDKPVYEIHLIQERNPQARISYAKDPGGIKLSGTASELKEKYMNIVSHTIPPEFKRLDEALEVIVQKLNNDPYYLTREFLLVEPNTLMLDKAKPGEAIGKNWAKWAQGKGLAYSNDFGYTYKNLPPIIVKGKQYRLALEFKANVLERDPEGIAIGATDLVDYRLYDDSSDLVREGSEKADIWANENQRWEIGNWSESEKGIMNKLDPTGIRAKLLEGLKNQKIKYDKNWRPVFKR